jgi:hypothetical protein
MQERTVSVFGDISVRNPEDGYRAIFETPENIYLTTRGHIP